MQDNDQNNWKQLLENADSLPAEVLKDKNAAWEKLYTRLYNKPARKHRTWYWAAALLLAISITTIVFFNNEKHQPSVAISSPARQARSIKKQPLHAKQKESAPSPLSSSEKKNMVIAQNNSATKKNEPASDHYFLIDSAKEQTISATVIEPESHFDSSAKEILITAPSRKKLRVIHINDLGQPMEESTADNHFNQRDRFQLRILNNENFNPISTNPARNGLILFKSRNTSN